MPSKLREWFDELGHLDHLNVEDHTLQRAFAVVIYHVINADKIETDREKKRFSEFFLNDFGLDDLEIYKLHKEASQFDKDFDTYLDVLKEKIGAYPEVEVKLLKTLNSIMVTQKFNKEEFAEFEKIRDTLL